MRPASFPVNIPRRTHMVSSLSKTGAKQKKAAQKRGFEF
jgi:hypothetical protein